MTPSQFYYYLHVFLSKVSQNGLENSISELISLKNIEPQNHRMRTDIGGFLDRQYMS